MNGLLLKNNKPCHLSNVSTSSTKWNDQDLAQSWDDSHKKENLLQILFFT